VECLLSAAGGFGFQQSVAAPQSASVWARPPCRHFKNQSSFSFGWALPALAGPVSRSGSDGHHRRVRERERKSPCVELRLAASDGHPTMPLRRVPGHPRGSRLRHLLRARHSRGAWGVVSLGCFPPWFHCAEARIPAMDAGSTNVVRVKVGLGLGRTTVGRETAVVPHSSYRGTTELWEDQPRTTRRPPRAFDRCGSVARPACDCVHAVAVAVSAAVFGSCRRSEERRKIGTRDR
jgi:hypothetical protein